MRLLFLASLIFCEVLWTSLTNQAEAGTLTVHVADSHGSPRSDMRVQRYRDNWRSIDHKLTDRDGNVSWMDIPAGTYRYRVLENSPDRDFWGAERIVVPSMGTRPSFFERKSPHIAQVKKPSFIGKGKQYPITITVSNKETHAVSTKMLLRISEPAGKGSRGYERTQGPVSIRPGESRTFQFHYSPRDTGRNYVLLSAMVFGKYRNKYVRTDTRRSDWYVTVEPGAHRQPSTPAVRSITKAPRPAKPTGKQEIRTPVSPAEKKPAQKPVEEAPIPIDEPRKSIQAEETVPEIPRDPGSSFVIIVVLLSIGIIATLLILLRAKIALVVQKPLTLLKRARISWSERGPRVRRKTASKIGEIQPKRSARRNGSVGRQVEDLEKLLWIKKDEEDKEN